MEWTFVFQGAVSFVFAGIAIWIGTSINSLNIKLAVLIERISSHELRISKLEEKK